jgi:hypothetical protein
LVCKEAARVRPFVFRFESYWGMEHHNFTSRLINSRLLYYSGVGGLALHYAVRRDSPDKVSRHKELIQGEIR